MAILEFPPLESADQHGLIAIGGDLEVESLLLAYSHGIFPWPVDESYLTWFAPPKRAILNLDNFHVADSLKRSRNKGWPRFAIDKNFEEVVSGCQKVDNRVDQGTWITEDLKSAYVNLHLAGHAHSFECYKDNVLVGGVYGVNIGGMFTAESMFYSFPDASKLALWFMVDCLKASGVPWIDVQVINPFSARLGVVEITREQFMKLLSERLDSVSGDFKNSYNKQVWPA